MPANEKDTFSKVTCFNGVGQILPGLLIAQYKPAERANKPPRSRVIFFFETAGMNISISFTMSFRIEQSVYRYASKEKPLSVKFFSFTAACYLLETLH